MFKRLWVQSLVSVIPVLRTETGDQKFKAIHCHTQFEANLGYMRHCLKSK